MPGQVAPSSASAASKKLTPNMRRIFTALIFFGTIFATVGAAGLAVLLDDEKRQYWISHTEFAELWRWVAQKNPMALNIVFNGGLICVVMSAVRLHEDTKARAAEKAAKKTK